MTDSIVRIAPSKRGICPGCGEALVPWVEETMRRRTVLLEVMPTPPRSEFEEYVMLLRLAANDETRAALLDQASERFSAVEIEALKVAALVRATEVF